MRYTIRGTDVIGADLIDPHMLSDMTWWTTEKQRFANINPDLITLWISPVNLISSGIWDKGMTQAGSGVAGLSLSGIGFNHSGLCLIFGRWVESVSSESDILTSTMLMTKELETVMNQKCQCYVVLFYKDPNLVEEEEGLDHYVVSCETCPFQQETRPSMPVPWMPQELRKVLHVLEVICKSHSRTSVDEGSLSCQLRVAI
nr:hypothetical protein [Tanacetum cinerariifolium]